MNYYGSGDDDGGRARDWSDQDASPTALQRIRELEAQSAETTTKLERAQELQASAAAQAESFLQRAMRAEDEIERLRKHVQFLENKLEASKVWPEETKS